VTTVDRPAPTGVEVVTVESAADMEAAVVPRSSEFDVIVMAAAVADFRPKSVADRKIKKGDGLSEIVLEPTHDFLVDLGRNKRPGQIIVGFAAETDHLESNAADKLARKNLDLIVGNDVGAPNVGFAHDTNAVTIVTDRGHVTSIPLSDKRVVADAICDAIVVRRNNVL
jgi:phosphopantothenoylcysteine decarboxylase / phosphopantothenate---cysteine ligase